MNKQGRQVQGYILILIGGALWGTIGPFIRIMEQLGSNASLTSFLRMFFSFLLLFVFVAVKDGISAFKVSRKQLFFCALLGLVCHGIYNAFYSVAVNLVGVTISAVLLNIAPFFTALISRVFFREGMTRFKVIALCINVIGCILAATGGQIDVATFSFVGILCGFAAGFCYSLTAIFGKVAGESSNVFTMSVYSYFFAALFLALYARPWSEVAMTNGKVLVVGVLYAMLPTIIAYLLYYRGVQIVTESSKVPVLASVEMIVAGILGVLFFQERLHAINFIGIGCVLLSIVLMNAKIKERKRR